MPRRLAASCAHGKPISSAYSTVHLSLLTRGHFVSTHSFVPLSNVSLHPWDQALDREFPQEGFDASDVFIVESGSNFDIRARRLCIVWSALHGFERCLRMQCRGTREGFPVVCKSRILGRRTVFW